jgi:hypothetical protein
MGPFINKFPPASNKQPLQDAIHVRAVDESFLLPQFLEIRTEELPELPEGLPATRFKAARDQVVCATQSHFLRSHALDILGNDREAHGQ